MSDAEDKPEAPGLVLGLCAWLSRVTAVEWTCLVAGLFLVLHYAWFMDDAFVFFRYVDNLLFLGHGLVWNAGEYVEGFSSALWVLILIPLRATGADYWLLTRLLGVVTFACFWALLVALNRRLAPRGSPTVNVPLCYLTFNYGALCYFTSGLETPLVQVAAVAHALYVLNPRSRGLQIFLGVTPLLRHELALGYLACFAWGWLRTRRFPLPMFLSALLVPGGWMVFRVFYYADLFPNTFYLKDELDVAQGWAYLMDTVQTYWLHLFLLLNAVGLLLLWRRRAGHDAPPTPPGDLGPRLLMVCIALALTAYVVKIGGDPRHYRYLSFPFCLMVCATGGILESALARLAPGKRRATAAGAGLLLCAVTVSFHPPQLAAHPFFGKTPITVLNKINDAAGHRHNKNLAQPTWGRGVGIEFRDEYADYRAARAERAERPYSGVDAESNCVTMFRAFDTRWVHSLGLTDPILSRTSAESDRPAHKLGLIPMSRHMKALIEESGGAPYPGMYREALVEGRAPPWVSGNEESIDLIERKMFNRHDFLENLGLAFTFPERIEPRMRRVPLPPGVQRPDGR